ncbi:MAG TPA: hypothetical protein VNM92_06075 [Thermoanaerobaculia bacterium]|nr:hypothetical protein [Thermoanaerobaculia bacterium]
MKFSEMPSGSHAWVFASNERLSVEASRKLLDAVDAFLAQWASHGQPNVSARELRENRFLIVAADESHAPSGCGIDKLFSLIAKLEQELGMSLIDSSRVFHRDKNGEIVVATRDEFRKLAQEGKVGLDTAIFDIAISELGDVVSGKWETQAGNSWHARAFPLRPAGELAS